MFCKCFTLVTCKIKHVLTFYFTCNHGLKRVAKNKYIYEKFWQTTEIRKRSWHSQSKNWRLKEQREFHDLRPISTTAALRCDSER